MPAVKKGESLSGQVLDDKAFQADAAMGLGHLHLQKDAKGLKTSTGSGDQGQHTGSGSDTGWFSFRYSWIKFRYRLDQFKSAMGVQRRSAKIRQHDTTMSGVAYHALDQQLQLAEVTTTSSLFGRGGTTYNACAQGSRSICAQYRVWLIPGRSA